MMKVNSRKVITSVAMTTYRANKKRNALTVFAVILTTFLITAVLGIGISYWDAVSERSIRMNGMDYDIELTEPRAEQVEMVGSMDAVKYAGVAVKCAIAEEYQDKSLDKTRLYWVDDTCWEKQCIPAYEFFKGDYPKEEEELVLSTTALKDMGIKDPKIGMKLPLTYYSLAEDPERTDLEDAAPGQQIMTKTFILSGYYRDYSGKQYGYVSQAFYKTSGVRQTDFTQGALKITLKKSLYSTKDIMNIQTSLNLKDRQVLIADDQIIQNFNKMAAGLGALLLMILISGYLFVYNTLYISVSKDIRYYGQLKTVGMTSVQLKRMVYLQALWNSCIGIPVGMVLGVLVSAGIVPMAVRLMDPSMSEMKIVTVHPLIYIGAALFSAATVIAGCRKPAIITGECSPIEAVRYTGLTEGRKKEKEREKGLKDMARRNMFRDRKQAVVILGSFFVVLTVFLCVNAVVRGNDAKNILNQISSCDITVKNQTTLEEKLPLITKEKLEEIRAIEGVKEIRPVTTAQMIVPYQEELLGAYYKRLYQTRYSPGDYEKEMAEYKKDAYTQNDLFDGRFVGISLEEFRKIEEILGKDLDEEAFEKGEIAVTEPYWASAEEMEGKELRFILPDSQEPEKEHRITIAAAGKSRMDGGRAIDPSSFAGGYSPNLLVSNALAEKLMGNGILTELVRIEYKEPYDRNTEKAVKNVFGGEEQISFESKLSRYQEMKASEQQVKILGVGMGVILAVLSILNYINMMAAGVQNRAREFATLESLGMTSGQIKKVLIQEGLGYGILSILLSMAAGLPLSYMVFQSVKVYNMGYSMPVLYNLTLFAVIIAVCVIVPPVIYRMTQKETVIERLRRDME
ncbi:MULTISPECIES: ABC transporter permease [Blautia]|uniref:ABC transporter permease n=1 Tax=Blautia TaxID=572511 RepID=UPI00210C4F0A|nr:MULTISPECIES: ABC transporter permease [Blautia]MCQ4744921.1 ABC transporter permease [Blautia producta]